MYVISLIVGLVLFSFIVHQFKSSEIVITFLVLLVLMLCVLHMYYNNTESGPQDLYNENVKRLKKNNN
ncbi:hypothetical protein [Erinnyis ello granulovirus]|uniref:Uncharacterized protein n=1 Tax=Erinnyis ello granulovirus TaxID=307444 RepID=A0A097DAQ3_9BBAC|nr:hypothetical protein [Erinnyis ello granulovirus]AIS92101.1 hypothetical protein [Erinnyis ello granulovirus]